MPTKRLKSKVKGSHKAKAIHGYGQKTARGVSVDLFDGISKFKRRISKKELETAWESGRTNDIDSLMPWDKLPDDLYPSTKKIKDAMFKASKMGIGYLPPPAKHMRWDIKNPKIRDYVDKRTGKLIADIQSEARDHVKSVVARSFTHAMTPRQVADEIVGSIGLHKRYRTALKNYTDGLIKQGKSPKFIHQAWGEYEQRLLKSRSMAVARTEVRRATNFGQRAVWREASDQGYIDRKTSKRIWVIDGNPCEICEPMDGAEADIDGTYPGGFEPGEVHPQCECIEILEIE